MKHIPNREDIPKLYVEGKLSTLKIGRIVGLTPAAVASILSRRGIKLRSFKEARKIQYPDGTFGVNSPRWKGGRKIANSRGYIHIYSPEHPFKTKAGYVMEHRLVMEKKIGRYIKKGEIVHHINHDKTDNRPENLAIKKNGQHIKDHFDAGKNMDKVLEILDLYRKKYGRIIEDIY